MNYFLQKGEVLPYHSDPTILEAGNILLIIFSTLIFIWVYRQLKANPAQGNALDPGNENAIVSPFLITENEAGLLGFERMRKRKIYKVVAIFLIFIFVMFPLVLICRDLGMLQAFYN